MPIAELFLGAFLKVLFERLASQELLEFVKHEGIGTQLQEWNKILKSIEESLDNAEDKQLSDSPGVKSWLKDLTNLAYDIEDLLDEFTTESIKSESQAEPSTSKTHSLLPSCCVGLSPRAMMFGYKMRVEIEKMDKRLQKIKARKDILSLGENKEKQPAHCQPGKPLPTTNFPKPWFVCREDDKREILQWLTQKEDGGTCADPEVLAIIGMAGVGKTALVQQVFNDDRVDDHFDVKAWACISDDFDVLAITKSILRKTNFTLSNEDNDLDWLQSKLREKLSGKKFLVVLDDNWNKDRERWMRFLSPFQGEAKGSKIIVTTRDTHVAKISLANKEHHLEELSQDACMTLLAFYAFGVGNFDGHLDLKEWGWKIAEKCKGLPLAATTLGGSLCYDISPHRWEAILNSKIWNPSIQSKDILPALKLSYLRLPSNLRRCFAYCAIFPKDYAIKRDELIHWWSAEGLLVGEKQKSRWNTGLDYFNDLVSRSLFQKSSSDESQVFMHDLVNDLAKLVAGATCFDYREFEGDHNNTSSHRHASFTPNEYILLEKFKIYHGMKRLRSFISLDKLSRNHSLVFVSQKVLCELLSALKYLRVLSLSHYQIVEVPESIGKLRHLRHLDLSYTTIKTVPKSIVALYNLEALILRGCEYLLELPKGIETLINLRFLDITNTRSLETMPLYIGKLVDLEMLSKFVVGAEDGSRLEELQDLKNLRGELCISNLHMVRKATDASDANLCEKKGICQLTLQWSTDFENSRNEELEEEVLKFLRPHENFKNLTISHYGGLKFPSWLGSPSHDDIVHLCLHDMVHLRLHGCQKVKALPSLGQLPSLKELYIEDLNAICTIGSEFYGSNSPFPSLITLEFKGMPLWKDWSHCVGTEEIGVVFPCLKHVIICCCPMLIGRLPNQLSSLIKLEICSCPCMDASCMDASPSVTSLSSLNELDFKGCNEGVLKSLVMLTSLTSLVIDDVPELTCLYHEFTSSLNKLEKLEIRNCKELMHLWQDDDVIRDLARLKSLVVESCEKFIYFMAGEGDIELPGNLENIELTNCFNLKKLPNKMHTLSSLRRLSIHGCEELRSLPGGLGIYPDEPSSSTSSNTHSDMTSCQETLRIYECNPLPASPFSKGRFLPATLKRLEIRGCKRVESLVEINIDRLQSLQEILIWDCEDLRSLPQGLDTLSTLTSLELFNCPALELECFPPLPRRILKFSLRSCPKIKSLPNQLHQLTSLRHLEIRWCESITCFPDGGLPPQLRTLALAGCKNIKQPVGEWLTHLTSLKWLLICGSVGGAGEKKDLVLPLPSFLLDLRIFDMKRVKSLSGNLPPSLRKLLIHDCPNLRDLPRDGLPPSLEYLQIKGCEKLMERCREPNGDYWPRICEIPCVALTEEAGDYSESPPLSPSVSFPRCFPRMSCALHH